MKTEEDFVRQQGAPMADPIKEEYDSIVGEIKDYAVKIGFDYVLEQQRKNKLVHSNTQKMLDRERPWRGPVKKEEDKGKRYKLERAQTILVSALNENNRESVEALQRNVDR